MGPVLTGEEYWNCTDLHPRAEYLLWNLDDVSSGVTAESTVKPSFKSNLEVQEDGMGSDSRGST